MEHTISPENQSEELAHLSDETITENPYQLFIFGYQNKLADRYCQTLLFHQRFHSQPILLVVSTEIINPWHPAREIGSALGQTISRELSSAESQSLIIRFEASLKAANQFIALQSQQITTSIHSSVALFWGKEVHFSGIGEGAITLARHHQTSRIAPQQTTDQTFSVVTSGDLQEDDWLMVGTSASALATKTAINFVEQTSTSNSHFDLSQLTTDGPWSGALVRYVPTQALEENIYFDTPESQSPIHRARALTGKLNDFLLALKPTVVFVRKQIIALWRGTKKLLRRLPEPKFLRSWPVRVKQLVVVAVALLLIVWIGTALWQRHKSSPTPTTLTPTNPLILALNLNDADLSIYLAQHFKLEDYQTMSAEGKTNFGNRLEQARIHPVALSTPIAQLSNPGIAIDRLGDTAYILDSTGQVWLLKGADLRVVTQTQLIPRPLSLVAVKEDKLVVSDQSGNIWLINPTTGATSSLSLPSEIQTGIKLVQKFDTNLYLYAVSNGNFYRVANFAGDLSKAAIYTKKETLPLHTVSDFAVNGQVIAIDQLGKIQDFSRNQLGKFTTTLTTNRSGASFHLDGQADSSHLVAGSGTELIIYPLTDPTQSVSDFLITDRGLTDLATTANSAWLLIDKVVYQISL